MSLTTSIVSIFSCFLKLAAVWGSRTYAVYNRNKIILAIFVALGLTVVGVSVVRDALQLKVWDVVHEY